VETTISDTLKSLELAVNDRDWETVSATLALLRNGVRGLDEDQAVQLARLCLRFDGQGTEESLRLIPCLASASGAPSLAVRIFIRDTDLRFSGHRWLAFYAASALFTESHANLLEASDSARLLEAASVERTQDGDRVHQYKEFLAAMGVTC
jgi:hypothetical protein